MRFFVLFVCIYFYLFQSSQAQKDDIGLEVGRNKEIVLSKTTLKTYQENGFLVPDSTKNRLDYLKSLGTQLSKIALAQEYKLDQTQDYIEELATYRDLNAKAYEYDPIELDNLIKSTYELLKNEINVSYILLKLDPSTQDSTEVLSRITQIRDKIINGLSFSEAALQFSEDPSVKKNKGNLGYITTLQLNELGLAKTLFSTPIGKITTPIRTPLGYSLWIVHQKRTFSGKIKIAHILVKTETKIDSIYTALKNGESFEDLARKHSIDLTSKYNNGILNYYYSLGDGLEDNFESTAFSLKKVGNYSLPIKTRFGWHIIQLIDKKDLQPLSQQYEYIKQKLIVTKTAEIAKKVLINRLKPSLYLDKNGHLITATDLVQLSDFLRVTDRDNSIVLMRISDISYTMKDFIKYAQTRYKNTTISTKNSYNQWIDEKILEHYQRNLEQTNSTFAQMMDELGKQLLLSKLKDKFITQVALKDSALQMKMFQKNQKKYDYKKEWIEAQVITSTNKSIFNQMTKIAEGSKPYLLPIRPIVITPTDFSVSNFEEIHLFPVLKHVLPRTSVSLEISYPTHAAFSTKVSQIEHYLKKMGVPISQIMVQSFEKSGENQAVTIRFFTNLLNDFEGIFKQKDPNSNLTADEGRFYKIQQNWLSKFKWSIGKHRLQDKDTYIWVNISSVGLPRFKTFSEALPEVIRDLTQDLTQKIEKEALEKYPIKIY